MVKSHRPTLKPKHTLSGKGKGPAVTPSAAPSTPQPPATKRKTTTPANHLVNRDMKSKLACEISHKLHHEFAMARWYMMALGKFPFKTKKKYDGTFGYVIVPFYYPQALWFYFTTILSVVICIGILVGIGRTYLMFGGSVGKDRCKQTWETTMFTRHFDVIIFFLTALFSSAYNGVHIWMCKSDICHFMNYWSNMMEKIQVDCTRGLRWRSIFIYVSTFVVTFLVLLCYFTEKLLPFEESVGFIMQSCLPFVPDLYAYKARGGPMTVRKYIDQSELCWDCKDCSFSSKDAFCREKCWNVHTRPSTEYEVMKGFSSIILWYCFLSSLGFHVLFMFFCRSLINTSETWNARFSIAVSSDRSEDVGDEIRRRINMKSLAQDFGLVTELYQMTEEIFGLNLAAYYLMMMICIITDLYFYALMTVQKTCSEWILDNINVDSPNLNELNCNNWRAIMQVKHLDVRVSFEDPCRDYVHFRQQQGILCGFHFLLIMLIFMSTILEGHQAVNQGLLGFRRLRKYNYMGTKNKEEEYFVHTVKLVYLGPCAIHISSGSYFIVRRKLFIIVYAAVFVYLMMLIGFRPGQIRPSSTCKINVSVGPDGEPFVFSYPRITAYG